MRVSIHAPRVGRDALLPRRNASFPERFNPRAPRGARQLIPSKHTMANLFQSTRPAWGATRSEAGSAQTWWRFNPRAPRGARRFWQSIDCFGTSFNPRAPRGARLAASRHVHLAAIVSIHAPRVGRDPKRGLDHVLLEVFQSTRPAWGATPTNASHAEIGGGFNPRAPRGARLEGDILSVRATSFQSTRPAWGATDLRRSIDQPLNVSIHAPRVGRDPAHPPAAVFRRCFNPRAPRGARRHHRVQQRRLHHVSIHAPRVGRDQDELCYGLGCDVSIHAPRVGRDVDR